MKFNKILFYFSIAFIICTIVYVVCFNFTNYEFIDSDLMFIALNITRFGLPISVLLTLVQTLKKTRKIKFNLWIIAINLIVAFGSMFFIFETTNFLGEQSVYNQKVLYRNKADSTKTIKLQRLYGFLGSVDYRIVQTKPFLYLWNEVEFVDTATINKSEWIYVNEKL